MRTASWPMAASGSGSVLRRSPLNGTEVELKPLSLSGERGAAVNVASRDIQAVDAATDFQPFGEGKSELNLGLRLELSTRPCIPAGKTLEVVQHGVAQTLGVVAVGDVLFFQVAREDLLKEGRDIPRLAPPLRQHLVYDVALFEEGKPLLGAKRGGLEAHQIGRAARGG